MSRSPVQISPEEVRAFAHFPQRPLLALSALLVLLCAALLMIVRGSFPVFAPPPPFDPSNCAAEPLPELCLEQLPDDLRSLPTEAQYLGWRMSDVLGSLSLRPSPLPEDPIARKSLLADAAALLRGDEHIRTRIERSLARDPFARKQASKRPLAGDRETTVTPETWTQQLLTLGRERDWSAAPAAQASISEAEIEALGLPAEEAATVRTVVEANLALQTSAEVVLREYAEDLGRERAERFQIVWQKRALTEAAQLRERALEHEFAVASWWLLTVLAYSLPLISLLLGISWLSLGPREVVVGLHRLRFGRREIPWSDVVAVDWRALSVRLRGRAEPVRLGPRVLPAGAEEALKQAGEQAKARSKKLSPFDARSHEDLQRLRQ